MALSYLHSSALWARTPVVVDSFLLEYKVTPFEFCSITPRLISVLSMIDFTNLGSRHFYFVEWRMGKRMLLSLLGIHHLRFRTDLIPVFSDMRQRLWGVDVLGRERDDPRDIECLISHLRP
jgi:hypothetical protein